MFKTVLNFDHLKIRICFDQFHKIRRYSDFEFKAFHYDTRNSSIKITSHDLQLHGSYYILTAALSFLPAPAIFLTALDTIDGPSQGRPPRNGWCHRGWPGQLLEDPPR